MSTPKTEFESLAISYLSGYASTEEISRYQELHETDPVFRKTAREIELWLAPLSEDIPELEAPEGLLEAILAGIEPQQNDNSPSAELSRTGGVVPLTANDNRAHKWKAISAVSSLVAIIAIGSHFVDFGPQAPIKEIPSSQTAQTSSPEEQFLAILADGSKPELVAIIYNSETQRIVASLSNIAVPEDGDLQLWLIREGEAAPQSLGVLDRAHSDNQFEFDIPAALNPSTDILAISLEQKGGSPSAAPEGTVLFTGAVSKLPKEI